MAHDDDTPVVVISVAAELAGVIHADAQAAAGFAFEGVADPAHRGDGRIILRMHIGGGEHAGGATIARAYAEDRARTRGAQALQYASAPVHASRLGIASTATTEISPMPSKLTRACCPARMS